MRFGNLAGRLALITDRGAIDVCGDSGGRLPADPLEALEQWDAVLRWAGQPHGTGISYEVQELLPPVPRPRQVFAVGLNYVSHAAESRTDIPSFPTSFTKYPTCLTGPEAVVTLPSATVDWEVELVVVVGRPAHRIDGPDGWSYVAGVTIGQDLTDREVQLRPPLPQFSLGKSFPGFGPIGPYLVTPDELPHPDDLEISCRLNGELVQSGRTKDLIFSVPTLMAQLSSIVALLPGDLVFTGTPAGVGFTRTPPRYLAGGDELVSAIEGVGTLRTRFLSNNRGGSVSAEVLAKPLATDVDDNTRNRPSRTEEA